MSQLIKPAEVVNGGIYRPSPTNARFDIQVIAPHIVSTEERFLVDLVGSEMYVDMIAKQNAAVSNYNPDAGALVAKFPNDANYESLWTGYLLRYLGYCVYYEVLPFVAVQTGSKGVYLNDSEFAQNGGLSAVKFMQDTILQKIDNLKETISSYLCKNKATYPKFDATQCPCSTDINCGCDTCKSGKNTSTNIIFH